MRRLLLSFSLLVLSCAPLFADEIGHARQHPINDSGIQGHIFIVDTGNSVDGLLLLGTATGLDPTKTYVSLIYDNGSVPGGPMACEPTSGALAGRMFIGIWTVDADGSGSLFQRKRGPAYAALSEFRTISIRQVVPVGLPQLRACGEVAANPVH